MTRPPSVCGLLLLCVWCSVNPGSPTHNVQRRETAFTWNYSAIVGTKMTVSPAWYLGEGDAVEITCIAHTDTHNNSDEMDLQLVWTEMGSRNKTVLVSRRASAGISYVLGPITHEHQGVYTCDGDGSLPHVYVHAWHRIIWVADTPPPPASIDVISHNRSQFLNGETFTVSCRLPDANGQWKMMRFDDWTGNITECPDQVASDLRLSCTVHSEHPWSDHLYWCESPAGGRSNALNITTTVVTVALEGPTLPVLEGDDVTLRCLHRNRTTKEFTPTFRALFYQNDRLKYRTDGGVTLTAVTKADEGVYKCRHPMDGLSHDSWVTVRARPHDDQKSDAASPAL